MSQLPEDQPTKPADQAQDFFGQKPAAEAPWVDAPPAPQVADEPEEDSEDLARMNAALDRAIQAAATEHRLVSDHTPVFGKRKSIT